MNQRFYGSLCLTDLIDAAKAGHSAFSKSTKNGKIYVNANLWVNAQADKFGNDASVQLNPTKEKREVDKQLYIANFKKAEDSKPVSLKDAAALDVDLPESGHIQDNPNDPDAKDLPF